MFRYALRPVLAILTALYLLLAPGACAVQPPEEVHAPAYDIPIPSSTDTVTVNILQSVPRASLPLQQAVELYAPEGVAFHIQTVAGRADYRAALRSKLLAGEAVDLFHLLDRADVQRLQEGLEDLSGSPLAEQALPGTLDTVSAGEHLYGLPYALEGIGLLVNRAVFETAGIPLAAITSFETLSESLQQLQTTIDSGELAKSFPDLVAVADLAVQDREYLAACGAELLLTDALPASPTQMALFPALDFSAADSVEEFWKLLARVSPQRSNWKDLANIPRSRVLEHGLAAGRIAVALENTDTYHRIAAIHPDIAASLVLLPVYLPNNEQGLVFTGSPAWWAVNQTSDSASKTAALDLLAWLYTSPDGAELFASEFGSVSPYSGSPAGTAAPFQYGLQAALQGGTATPWLVPQTPEHWGEEVFAPALQAYFSVYDTTWNDMLADCQQGWEQP